MTTIHGEAANEVRSREYAAWSNMKNRCYTADTPYYKNYGGRGIKVCERWRNSYLAFLEDVGRRPGPGYSLDRINNDGDYEPENVRWATRREQNRNQRNSGRPITAMGQTKPLDEWAKQYGLSRFTILSRLQSGWHPDAAVSRPSRPLSWHKSLAKVGNRE